jgi:hypothetical protein
MPRRRVEFVDRIVLRLAADAWSFDQLGASGAAPEDLENPKFDQEVKGSAIL